MKNYKKRKLLNIKEELKEELKEVKKELREIKDYLIPEIEVRCFRVDEPKIPLSQVDDFLSELNKKRKEHNKCKI